jgi:CHAT domain-containing protein/tetratricopeptide (TPR) repeat protein
LPFSNLGNAQAPEPAIAGWELLFHEWGHLMRYVLVSCTALMVAATGARAQFGEYIISNQMELDMAGLPVAAVAHDQGLLPVPSAQGNAALAQLLKGCQAAGGVTMVEDAGSHSRSYLLADVQKVRAAVAAHRRLLTPALRDAVVARWNMAYKIPARRERLGGFAGFGKAIAAAAGGIQEPITRVDEDQQRLGVVLLGAIGDVTQDDRARAFAVFLMGQAEERRGDLAAALRDYERASQLFVRVKDPAWEAGCLNNLGAVYSEQGEYVRALDRFQQAVALGTQARGADHPLVATCLENMGEVYARQEDYPRAEESLRTALAIWSKAPGEHRPRMATALVGLGDVYARQEKVEALRPFEQALAIWQELLSENRPGASDRIALLNSDPAFDMVKALEDLQALSTLRKIYGDDTSPMAATLDRIGDVYAGRQQYDEALDQYRRALDIRRQLHGDDHPGIARGLRNIGSVHRRQGKFAEARDDLRGAVLASRQAPGTTPAVLEKLEAGDLRPLPLTAEVLYDYGRLLERDLGQTPAISQLRACARTYRLATDVLERMRQEVLQAEASKVVLGAERFDLFARHIGICRRLFAAEGKAEDLTAAFTLAEQGSARVFLEQMSRSRAESIGGVGDDLRRQETDLVARLRSLDDSIVREQNRPLNQRDADRLTRLFEEHRQAEAERVQLVTHMEREYPRYVALMYPRPCSPTEARACLGDDEVALLYVLGDEASYLVVVIRDDDPQTAGIAVHRLAPAGEIGELVAALTQPAVLDDDGGVRDLGARAYRMLLAPAAAAIRGKGLVIVPGGALGLLPFELLVEPAEGTEADGRDAGQYLVQGHRLRYAPSLTALHVVRQWDQTRSRPGRSLWAMGDPVYQPSDPRAAARAAPAEETRHSLTMYRGAVPGESFERLPSSGVEVERLGRFWGATPEEVLIGPAATEAAVKRASAAGTLAKHRYVHFATHGILGLAEATQPALVLSLTGDQQGEDGFLRLDEVTHLRLNADLVVLSACQTGQGRLRNGEGVSGLARAFLYAGSRGVLCSLWQVADRETSELMVDFYAGLKAGKPATDALRDAQLRMIAAGEPPRFWAPFVLIGQ